MRDVTVLLNLKFTNDYTRTTLNKDLILNFIFISNIFRSTQIQDTFTLERAKETESKRLQQNTL